MLQGIREAGECRHTGLAVCRCAGQLCLCRQVYPSMCGVPAGVCIAFAPVHPVVIPLRCCLGWVSFGVTSLPQLHALQQPCGHGQVVTRGGCVRCR